MYDIDTCEMFITVNPNERQREQHEKSGTEAISWEYRTNGHHISRRRAGSNDEFYGCHDHQVPISVAAMLFIPEPVEKYAAEVFREAVVGMVDGFITAALWTENLYSDENTDDTPMDSLGFDPDNIAAESLDRIRRDCEMFLNIAMHAGVDILAIYGPEACLFPLRERGAYYDWGNIGHDFLLSRNGHGTGFFDRDIPHAKLFQHIAGRFSEIHAYTNDETGNYADAEWGVE